MYVQLPGVCLFFSWVLDQMMMPIFQSSARSDDNTSNNNDI
jgi:hypothetical protein